MTKPVRLQLSRRKGFNLQDASHAANGLPAVNVARPTKWGNPYKAGGPLTVIECVEAFRQHPYEADMLDALRGRNLACWCGLDEPCHADVWLERANRPNKEDRQ